MILLVFSPRLKITEDFSNQQTAELIIKNGLLSYIYVYQRH